MRLLQGKKLVFVTNNSTKSRKGYLGKFTGLGLNVSAEEIYSSSYAAAAYLESENYPKDKKVQAFAAAAEGPGEAFSNTGDMFGGEIHGCLKHSTERPQKAGLSWQVAWARAHAMH